MKPSVRRIVIAGVAATALAVPLLSLPLAGSASAVTTGSGPAFSLVNVGAYGGEPSITSDKKGVLYETTPSGLPSGPQAGDPPIYRSTDHGASWTLMQPADTSSGDDCLATDQARSLYWCNLGSMSSSGLPLQADVWKSTTATKCSTNCHWQHGTGTLGSTQCGTSCSPFGVDRQWVAASIPAGGTTANAEVVLMYHDFYGPSQIWVNISKDGGATFGTPIEVLANSSVPGAVVAQGYSMCNTVPVGTGIVRPGLPHAGRIYVAWIAADLPQNATGCNITMTQSFHTLWVAYSDDGGATWTAQQAFDAGIGHDASTPFAAFTLDTQGNPYIAFSAPGPADNPAVCAAESAAGTVQSDPSCAYHTWVVWSKDGGATWDGGGGLIPGSAAAAYEADPSTAAGTDVFPTIAAGRPGQVAVGWLHTGEIVPTDAAGKFLPGGCAGPGPANGNPPTYPPACDWNLVAGQSASLRHSPATAAWTSTAVTTTPVHVGDICNLGIFCVDPSSNRNLLDFNSETIDPTTGCAHIGFADDNTVKMLRVANQTSGCLPAR
jgi:BNR/Asp-box repeat protein